MLEDEQNDLSQQNGYQAQPPLEKNQKIAIGILVVFGILVFVFWFAQFKKNISSPFYNNSGDESVIASSTEEVLNNEELKSKDTDQDGISDYDELNIYKTSPYLADSDSDGIADSEEIKKGTDPNCPAGQNCFSSGVVNSSTTPSDLLNSQSQNNNQTTTTNQIVNQLNVSNQINQSSQTAASQSADTNMVNSQIQSVLAGGAKASELRQMLIGAGMDKTILDKISDADLAKTYQDALNSQK